MFLSSRELALASEGRLQLDREIERRLKELLQSGKARWEQEKIQEKDSSTREDGATWPDGGGSKGGQQRPKSESGSGWDGNRWDMIVSQGSKNSHQIDTRREGREP